MRIRWKIFFCICAVSMVLLSILWISQTVMFDVFYRIEKKAELKNVCTYVEEKIPYENINTALSFIQEGQEQINVRIVDTAKFESIYSTHQSFPSVMREMGIYDMFSIYQSALKNGGETTQYYIENSNGFNGREFAKTKRPPFFFAGSQRRDILYAKIVKGTENNEIMIVADTRMTPLKSTVSTLEKLLRAALVITVVLSLVISAVVSRVISKPIEKINKSALLLAGGKFETKFDGKGYREIEQLSETLNFTASELGRVEKLRKDLVANVSHDLRTPLTMIVGYSEAIRDIPGENTPENIQVIIDEANRLSEFVNSALDVSGLDGAGKKDEIRRENLTAMVSALVSRYEKMSISQENVSVKFFADDVVFVNCNAIEMSQVVLNLIDNAINYGGEPKEVKVFQRITTDGYVRIEIHDNGEGINENMLSHIWERYYRSEEFHKRNIQGSGLGLSIVKGHLEKMGARFGVESTKGQGTNFWFELKRQAE